ncbi:hypothetical protein HBIAX_03502 [Achromobacter xylosoxidans]|uniref:Uncharacterized protein n=1 Tax=Bordetella ansorpii TaxID=288768 RepID=A0A157SAU5_9BORD|nr:hypothetical protein HBIAX_03502 [Achromobacter xylosoxidans]SAI67499.1 Uncharacterised protein [Bordetella ansorpii]
MTAARLGTAVQNVEKVFGVGKITSPALMFCKP